jgi:hypothetical protein
VGEVRISVGAIADQIAEFMKEYTDDVTAGIEKELDETSSAVLATTQDNSPKKTGRYRKGWRRTKETSAGKTKYTIHNKAVPGLVHLLEKGHAKRGGGRVAGKPHLGPAYDAHVPTMEERIKKILRDGG